MKVDDIRVARTKERMMDWIEEVIDDKLVLFCILRTMLMRFKTLYRQLCNIQREN
jgi:hypothetical protein